MMDMKMLYIVGAERKKNTLIDHRHPEELLMFVMKAII